MTDPVSQLAQDGRTVKKPDPWKVRCAREHSGLTQAQVAELAGYGTDNKVIVSRIECYDYPIGKTTLARLCKALDRYPDDLVSRGRTFDRNRADFDQWRADGSPDLLVWLRKRREK